MDPYAENYYDERSHIDKAFQNWNGSVYWVQGMQDWNVDPHQVFGGPSGTVWYHAYEDAGYDVRGMLGQWEHNYPIQWSKHNAQDSGYGGEAIAEMTRWDWAEDLLEWFDYYLKGKGRSRTCTPKSSAMTDSGASNPRGLHATLNPRRLTLPPAQPTAVGWAEPGGRQRPAIRHRRMPFLQRRRPPHRRPADPSPPSQPNLRRRADFR